MKLTPVTKNYSAGKEILADTVGSKTINVTLDVTKFPAGRLEAGAALLVVTATKKAEPWDDAKAATGKAAVLGRELVLEGADVVGIGYIGGYLNEAKCTGITAGFKTAAKMISFQ